MNPIHTILIVGIIVLVTSLTGCSKKEEPSGRDKSEEELSVRDESEESNIELTLDAQYDKIRNGARLILDYDAQSNSFKGTVENTTNETLKQVRVEVHLSNGKELGPTLAVDLAPGEKSEVQLTATSTDFDGWTAHPEVGVGEHSRGGEHGEGNSEHGGEHDREGESEHN
ncbi:MAG: FxLYD domain-containing protein [Candidatus Poribacteria bacterium]|nr:FxLYD domain-containing protein [Candidatus Poribacteria bacterium]